MDALQNIARPCITNAEFNVNLSKQKFALSIFRGVAAKDKIFTGIDFKYCLFEECYFRNCRFLDCDFTGAQFRNTNLRGSLFDGSRFDYCRFAGSIVPIELLERNMPGYENVALELARSLRINFSQIGDTEGVNKAISAELAATRVHLKKAALSSEGYYRKKYKGLQRLKSAISYFWFNLLHLIWGNGESLWRIVLTLIVTYLVISLLILGKGADLGVALVDSVSLFWGTYRPTVPSSAYSALLVAGAVAVRYILFGLFLAVLVRRFSRR